jgi:C-terminal processing protease CtpA/Prc
MHNLCTLIIVYFQENGAAFEAGGLEVGQLILEVDGQKVEGKYFVERRLYMMEGTFILLMWTFGRAPNNANKWEMGFNSVA